MSKELALLTQVKNKQEFDSSLSGVPTVNHGYVYIDAEDGHTYANYIDLAYYIYDPDFEYPVDNYKYRSFGTPLLAGVSAIANYCTFARDSYYYNAASSYVVGLYHSDSIIKIDLATGTFTTNACSVQVNRSSADATNNSSICGYGDIVVAGNQATAASTDRISYSANGGLTWTDVTTISSSFKYSVGVNDIGTLWVAVAEVATATSGHVYTSTNGSSWTARTPSAAFGIQYPKVIWLPFLSKFLYLHVQFGTVPVFVLTSNGYTIDTSGNISGGAASIIKWDGAQINADSFVVYGLEGARYYKYTLNISSVWTKELVAAPDAVLSYFKDGNTVVRRMADSAFSEVSYDNGVTWTSGINVSQSTSTLTHIVGGKLRVYTGVSDQIFGYDTDGSTKKYIPSRTHVAKRLKLK